MKAPLLFFVSIFFVVLVQAQSHLELKVNRVLPYTLILPNEIALEGTLFKRIGVEGGIGFEKKKSTHSTYDSIGRYNILEIYRSKQVRYYIAGKYYFSPRTSTDGFFAGLMFYYNYYTFYEKNDQPIAKPNDTQAYGIESGYKWIVTQHMLVELSAGGLWSVEKLRINGRTSQVYDMLLRINAKLGYRF